MAVVEKIVRALVISEEPVTDTHITFTLLNQANWEICIPDDSPSKLHRSYLATFPLVIVLVVTQSDMHHLRTIATQCGQAPDTFLCCVIDNDLKADLIDLPVCDFVCAGNAEIIRSQLRGMLRVVQSQLDLRDANESLQRINHNFASRLSSSNRYGTSQILTEAIVQNVRHELATPLLQIKSAFKHRFNSKGKREIAEFAEQAIARLESIVDNISMIGSSLDIRRAPAMLHQIVLSMKRELPRNYATRGQLDRLVIDVPADLPPVYVDKKSIEIVLRQLIDNALKFSKGEIILSAREVEHGVVVSIEDRGIGIESEKLARIFDMFYQADLSTTKAYSGIGVGLTLVRHILNEHESEIHVDSKVGEGSTFSFLLEPVHL